MLSFSLTELFFTGGAKNFSFFYSLCQWKGKGGLRNLTPINSALQWYGRQGSCSERYQSGLTIVTPWAWKQDDGWARQQGRTTVATLAATACPCYSCNCNSPTGRRDVSTCTVRTVIYMSAHGTQQGTPIQCTTYCFAFIAPLASVAVAPWAQYNGTAERRRFDRVDIHPSKS